MIQVMIVDDQQIIRDGLKMILSLDKDIQIVKEASNGQQALEYIKQHHCDVVLMDIKMPVLNGVAATKKIKELLPDIHILVLTTFNDDEFIFSALKNGAEGYLLKDADSEQILDAIHTVFQNKIFLHPEVATKVVDAWKNNTINSPHLLDLSILTNREREIAQLVGQGKVNKDICETLFITEGTVKNHITNILEKLELHNRTELALYLHKHDKSHE